MHILILCRIQTCNPTAGAKNSLTCVANVIDLLHIYSFSCHVKMADQKPKYVVGKLILLKARTVVKYILCLWFRASYYIL